MEVILEIFLQVFGEFLIQLFAEALFDLGFASVGEALKRPLAGRPFLAGFGYVILGAVAGALSVWVVPHSLISSPALRAANVFLTPLMVGLCMVGIGQWRVRRGRDKSLLNRFSHGFIFAFAFAVVRYHWTSGA